MAESLRKRKSGTMHVAVCVCVSVFVCDKCTKRKLGKAVTIQNRNSAYDFNKVLVLHLCVGNLGLEIQRLVVKEQLRAGRVQLVHRYAVLLHVVLQQLSERVGLLHLAFEHPVRSMPQLEVDVLRVVLVLPSAACVPFCCSTASRRLLLLLLRTTVVTKWRYGRPQPFLLPLTQDFFIDCSLIALCVIGHLCQS